MAPSSMAHTVLNCVFVVKGLRVDFGVLAILGSRDNVQYHALCTLELQIAQ